MNGKDETPRTMLEKATELDFEEAFKLAVAMHQQAMFDPARQIYERLLAVEPDHPETLNLLGVVSHQLGDSDRGLELLRAAVDKYPDYADAHNNLGNVLEQCEKFDEAEVAYRRVLELAPEHVGAHNNLGVVCKARGQLDDAVKHFQRALKINPKHGDAHYNLANVLERQGKIAEAVEAARAAVEYGPSPMAMRGLASGLRKSGQLDEAIKVLRRCLELHPDDAVTIHELAACSGVNAPQRASDGYVKNTFDSFAGSFDMVLENLGYRVPQLIGEILNAEDVRELEVLDAGCGTGLCAPFLRPLAMTLTGVDLSPMMLARAGALESYDELVEAELTDYLIENTDRFDLIVSGDTLCYFGDLAVVCHGLAGSLRQGGRLIFTVEALDEPDRDRFRLNPTGRYSHTEAALRDWLASAGLAQVAIDQAGLRIESGEPVAGYVVCARKP